MCQLQLTLEVREALGTNHGLRATTVRSREPLLKITHRAPVQAPLDISPAHTGNPSGSPVRRSPHRQPERDRGTRPSAPRCSKRHSPDVLPTHPHHGRVPAVRARVEERAQHVRTNSVTTRRVYPSRSASPGRRTAVTRTARRHRQPTATPRRPSAVGQRQVTTTPNRATPLTRGSHRIDHAAGSVQGDALPTGLPRTTDHGPRRRGLQGDDLAHRLAENSTGERLQRGPHRDAHDGVRAGRAAPRGVARASVARGLRGSSAGGTGCSRDRRPGRSAGRRGVPAAGRRGRQRGCRPVRPR